MLDLIVSVPDHCLYFYFLCQLCEETQKLYNILSYNIQSSMKLDNLIEALEKSFYSEME